MTTPTASPARFQRRSTPRPPIVLLYGTPGVGKTTQAAAFPGAIVMQLEEGLGAIDVLHTDLRTTYADVVGDIDAALGMPPGTFVTDSIDHLEPLIWAETCARGNKRSIEDFGFGKGYIEADNLWREFLSGMTALRSAGWAVVMLAHSQVVRFDDPSSESYDRYTLKLHKRAAGLVTETADVIGFMHWEATVRDRENGKGSSSRAVGTGHRNIALVESPAWIAKSRYPTPPMIRMDADGHNLLTALHTAGAVLPTAHTDAALPQES
jgi:hypothetical protein